MTAGPIFVNGRSLSQPMTGLQRFSTEIVSAIGALMTRGERPEVSQPIPHDEGDRLAKPVSASWRLRERPVGQRLGHLWEQFDLPKAARGGVLANLGNTAPLLGDVVQELA